MEKSRSGHWEILEPEPELPKWGDGITLNDWYDFGGEYFPGVNPSVIMDVVRDSLYFEPRHLPPIGFLRKGDSEKFSHDQKIVLYIFLKSHNHRFLSRDEREDEFKRSRLSAIEWIKGIPDIVYFLIHGHPRNAVTEEHLVAMFEDEHFDNLKDVTYREIPEK
jgi:hypothetical protein